MHVDDLLGTFINPVKQNSISLLETVYDNIAKVTNDDNINDIMSGSVLAELR